MYNVTPYTSTSMITSHQFSKVLPSSSTPMKLQQNRQKYWIAKYTSQGHHDALVVQYMGFHCIGTWQYINCQLDELDLICNLETIFNLLCSLWCSIYASRLIINRNSKIRTCLLCYHSETIPLHDNRNLGSPVNKFFPPLCLQHVSQMFHTKWKNLTSTTVK